jgi:hypothetical protein
MFHRQNKKIRKAAGHPRRTLNMRNVNLEKRLGTPPAGRLMEEPICRISGDRRNRRRYEIDLALQYKVIGDRRLAQTGKGKTINVSGDGLACQFDTVLGAGSAIELAIAWPVLLNSSYPLKLVISGRVVRSDAASTAVRMEKYEFRTQRVRALNAAAGFVG